ncbi:MAG: lmo0937 family membrane protein [Sphingomonas sp.]
MLETIIIIILLMWVLGFSFHIAGGLIHLLLVVAVVVVLVRIIQGRRPV